MRTPLASHHRSNGRPSSPAAQLLTHEFLSARRQAAEALIKTAPTLPALAIICEHDSTAFTKTAYCVASLLSTFIAVFPPNDLVKAAAKIETSLGNLRKFSDPRGKGAERVRAMAMEAEAELTKKLSSM